LLTGLLAIAYLLSGAQRRSELAARGFTQPRDRWRELIRAADGRLQRTGAGRALAGALTSAGLELSPLAFLGLCAGAAVGGYLAAGMMLSGLSSALVGAACAGGCWVWVGRLRDKRREVLIGQLPEVARLISNGASAGLSLAGAIQLASGELDDPAGEEMRRVVQEMRVGRSPEEALEGLAERVRSREVGVLMTTLAIQQRVGGDVVRALQGIAETLDARKDLIREVRTILSGSVYTGYMVAGIGVATLLLLDLMSPGLLEKMLREPIGIAAVVIGGALYAVGFLMIRRATRIET
jgi:tight adherence protein B